MISRPSRSFRCSALVLVCGAFAALSPSTTARAEDKQSDKKEEVDPALEVDHLNIAARLIHDGHHDRALVTLAEVDIKDPKLDKGRFYTLRGIAHLEQQGHKEARNDLRQAVKHGQSDPAIQLYLAQACFNLQEYSCVLRALSKSKGAGQDKAGTWLMKGESEWQTGNKGTAISTLEQGAKRFPSQAEFDRVRIFHLIELGLYVEAASVSEGYLKRDDITDEDYVAIGEALRTARDFKRAQKIMEGARLMFPESEKVLVQLAHSYLDAGQKVASAMLFEEAARLQPKYALEAAELYKEGGLAYRASWINARVSDQKAKTKQRLSLLVDTQDFEAVTAMLPKLGRLGLLEDQNVRYAVAYAFFKTGQFSRAEEQLKQITEPQLFESALQLRKAIESCREAGWECAL